MKRRNNGLLVALLSLVLIIGSHAPAAMAYEDGDDAAILLDLAFLRPLGLVATVGGTVVFVASLPISIGTWSMRKTFNALVRRPASYTFVRDLGDPS
jgi:hypothetical protein